MAKSATKHLLEPYMSVFIYSPSSLSFLNFISTIG